MKSSGWARGGIQIERVAGEPKYAAIARALSAAIAAGDLAPGEALPSQRELAEAFEVTIMTVRQAISTLVESGAVVAEQGKGTFVSTPRFPLPLGPLSSLAEEVRAAGHTLTTQVLSHGPVSVSILERSRMKLRQSRAYEIVRLRSVDGRPLALQISLLPISLAKHLDVEALSDASLYESLANLGQVIDHARETVQAVTLDGESARLLKRAAGDPALLSARLTHATDGRVIVDDRALIPGDSAIISTERRAGDRTVPFTIGPHQERLPHLPFVRSAP